MPIGFLVTFALLVLAVWAMTRLASVRRGPRVVSRRPAGPLRAGGLDPDGLTAAERQRLYRRLGIDPATLRRYGRIDLLREPPAPPARRDNRAA